MTRQFRLIFLAAIVLLVSVPGQAQTLPGQAVTWADFNYVSHIASSISHVYFATTEGVVRYNKMERRWEEPLTGTAGIDSRDIQAIWVDRFDERLYARSGANLFEYDLLFERWYPIDEVPSLDSDSKHIRIPNMLYLPSAFTYSSEGYIVDPHGRRYFISDILDDLSGDLWLGIWGYGAANAGSASGIIELMPYGLIQNEVNTIFNDSGILWVSGHIYSNHRSGLTRFDPDENSFDYFESGLYADFPAADVNCLMRGRQGMYVGTNLGLYCLDPASGEIVARYTERRGLPDDNVLCVAVLGDSVFVGTEGGISLITHEGDTTRYVRPRQFLNLAVHDFQTTDSSLWIASDAGAFQLILESGELMQLQDPHSIVFGHAYDLERSGDNLWLASNSGMVQLNLETGATRAISTVSASRWGRSMAVNDRIAVVSEDLGITVFRLDEDPVRERFFTVEDGLASNTVLSLELDGDYLWVGTDRGLTRFLWNNPDRVD